MIGKVNTIETCGVCRTLKRNCVRDFGTWFCEDCYHWRDTLILFQRQARLGIHAESCPERVSQDGNKDKLRCSNCKKMSTYILVLDEWECQICLTMNYVNNEEIKK